MCVVREASMCDVRCIGRYKVIRGEEGPATGFSSFFQRVFDNDVHQQSDPNK